MTGPHRGACRTLAWLACLLVGCSAVGGCASEVAADARAIVFASSSLTAPFGALVEAFAASPQGTPIRLHCAGTPQLVVQIREGAPVDVFASADRVHLRRALSLRSGSAEPVDFATNRMAIAVAQGNPHGIRSLRDLARASLRVVLCGPNVPAGRYARRVLARAGVVVTSCSDEPSVRAVVTKVALGEVDAGIVYATDVMTAPRDLGAARQARVESVPIPAEHNLTAQFPIVRLAGGPAPEVGAAFVAFVRSARGREILARYGFTAP